MTKKISKEKENGIIYTPKWIVREILNNLDFISNIDKKILDPSCGDGAFLCEILKEVLSKENDINKVKYILENNIFGFDIDNNSLIECENNLNNILKESDFNFNVKWNLLNFDSLEKKNIFKYYEFFDFIVGNPPYIRIQHLGKERREKLQSEWKLSKKGSTDIYITFFEMGYKLLNKNGKLGFITPNTYLKTQAGKDLRLFFKNKKVIESIINFNHYQIFNNATTYTLITILSKNHNSSLFSLYQGNDKQEINFIDNININDLNNDNWVLKNNKILNRIKKIESRKFLLGNISKIHVGIQTLADDLYIFKNPKFLKGDLVEITLKDSRKFKIEKEILRPIIKVSILKDSNEKQNRFIIFPYEKINNKNQIIKENKMANKFPLTFKYFNEIKYELSQRDKEKINSVCFYAFGRSNGLDNTFGKKILTSPMNLKPNFILNEDENTTFYAGYCIKYDGDLRELLAALNSKDMDFYIKNTSRDYQNNWKSYAKSFIEKFGILNLSFNYKETLFD